MLLIYQRPATTLRLTYCCNSIEAFHCKLHAVFLMHTNERIYNLHRVTFFSPSDIERCRTVKRAKSVINMSRIDSLENSERN